MKLTAAPFSGVPRRYTVPFNVTGKLRYCELRLDASVTLMVLPLSENIGCALALKLPVYVTGFDDVQVDDEYVAEKPQSDALTYV